MRFSELVAANEVSAGSERAIRTREQSDMVQRREQEDELAGASGIVIWSYTGMLMNKKRLHGTPPGKFSASQLSD